MLTGYRFYNHMPVRDVRAVIGDEIWNSYFTCCVVRNPWDRVVSLYYWRCKREPRSTISQSLGSRVPQVLKKRGFGVYASDNKIAVDHGCHYENVEQELDQIRLRLQLPEKLSPPRAESGYRKDKPHYRELMNDSDREKIARLFAREIGLSSSEF